MYLFYNLHPPPTSNTPYPTQQKYTGHKRTHSPYQTLIEILVFITYA